MKPFITEFTIRWGDLDVNRHLANSGYLALFTDTRMRYLGTQGIDQEYLATVNLGPASIHETLHYFREVKGGDKVYADLELLGHSENGIYFQFAQHLYNESGKISAYLELSAAWMDLKARKLAPPSPKLFQAIQGIPRAEGFHLLKKEDAFKVSKAILQKSLSLPL